MFTTKKKQKKINQINDLIINLIIRPWPCFLCNSNDDERYLRKNNKYCLGQPGPVLTFILFDCFFFLLKCSVNEKIDFRLRLYFSSKKIDSNNCNKTDLTQEREREREKMSLSIDLNLRKKKMRNRYFFDGYFLLNFSHYVNYVIPELFCLFVCWNSNHKSYLAE